MTMRDDTIARFLSGTRWGDARRVRLAGDASNRRYDRLLGPDEGESHVLMDAPPDRGEDIRPFVHIAEWLTQAGLAAPACLERDERQGLLVLEDLGDDIYARVLERAPAQETPLYEAAVDMLAELHRHTPPEWLGTYDPPRMARLAALAWRWYRLEVTGAAEPREDAFAAAFEPVLARHAAPASVVILRDFHAENLIWRPDHNEHARVGLLDFQDALVGHPAYDLVSLLQDARRDVSGRVQDAMLDRFVRRTGADAEDFGAAFAVLGAQRNLRILGVFARLSLHFGKPHYVDLIPRVWSHLMADLDHPALTPVRDMVRADLPAPDQSHLQKLRDACGTIPTP
ncbi:aminoglycoside phosphotransferase family protein [Tranquillimonas alkanivorans]|uniref:Aminoglycoside phosphotransferase domain-containing protein n=1 Tax=Tranquillimonas alkanivorans TaxID=441119 RepID=A0A1I5LLJ2_9RHOB|nr:phosphotransferase [Tranquillimonas alkanivorans]SFO98178.1 hypothetical protein SAMN04488047_101709 [Tranquillimonas alkanivorans]